MSEETQFAAWLDSCLTVKSPDDDNKIEALQVEAREVFAASNSNEKSLARLLQSFGPGLTGKLVCRVNSLTVICGAVEGCQSSGLSVSSASLLRDFFLEQCGPVKDEEENWGEDFAELVRDMAMKCLAAVLGCPLEMNKGDLKELAEACSFYCRTAKTGVTRRCALPAEDDAHHHMPQGLAGITNGLSTLPRSRRSLCFNLLQSAVVSVGKIIQQTTDEGLLAKLASKMESEVTSFVSFVCTCMQGESDPRCLQQLLLLLHIVQEALEPLFRAGKLYSFPTTEMFDAVAPYYPINFTPPPNDNHGITRKGLNDALMAVLCYSNYDKIALSSSRKKNQDTMTSLSLGLALERLLPMDGDDSNVVASTSSEKKEAIDDLVLILFPEGSANTLECLHDGSMQQMSNALIITHHEAAVGVLMGGTDSEDDKRLAEACRLLISRIAACLESGKDKSMWNIFVKDPVTRMTAELGQQQTEGRISVAYLAALITSAAPQTIRIVLDSSMDKLIDALKGYSADEESAVLGAVGIGAFFSASKVAMDKAHNEGLVIHPHPVDSCCSKAFEALYTIYTNSTSQSLRTAVVIALDSVLRVTSSSLFEDPEKEQIGEFVSNLAADVLEATTAEKDQEESALNFARASAETLGGLCGKAMASDNSQSESTAEDCVLRSESVQDVLRKKVLVDLLFSSRQASRKGEQLRFDRIALARACSSSLPAASTSVESLLHALRDSLSGQYDSREAIECARALSYVLRHGGDVAVRAFHELEPPSVTVHDVLDLLSDLDPRKAARLGDSEEKKNVTSLDLPPTVEEVQSTQQMMQEIVDLLLPAYRVWVPGTEVMKLLSLVSNILPPLSSGDVVQLSNLLPLLAEALENGNLPSKDDPLVKDALKQSFSTCSELARHALNTEYDSKSRSASAACMHAYILSFAEKNQSNCLTKQLLVEVAIPALIAASKDMQKPGQQAAKYVAAQSTFLDSMNLCSTIGSAAAALGGSSMSTADEIAKFFVQLACFDKAPAPFSQGCEIDLSTMDCGGKFSPIVKMAASESFGSLLCYGRSPLWIQRQSHKTLKLLEPALTPDLIKTSAENHGIVAVLCHIVCSGNIKSMSLSNRGASVRIVVQALVSGLAGSDDLQMAAEISKVKRLLVASVLKLTHLFPGLLSSHVESLVIGLLRAFAGTVGSDPLSDVACKLLVLQAMESLCHLEMKKQALVAMKPAINSILSAAMNHPSRALRVASVRVQNVWYTLEYYKQ